MKKKVLSLLLIAAVVVSAVGAVPVLADTAWDGIAESEPALADGVYQIRSGAELAWFAQATKKDGTLCAALCGDIDLGGREWSPIGQPSSGYVTEAFSGSFDGKGYTVSNLSIHTNAAFYGLFWCVYGGTVKNLTVRGEVSTTGSTAGGVIGKLQGGTVGNCAFYGRVTAAKNYVGGIVGTVVSNGKAASEVTGCYNAGEINGKYAGGIVGYATAKLNIRCCYNTGMVTGTTRGAGIAGQQTAGTIAYCYSVGGSKSGISGFCNAAVTNCYYLNETVAPGGSATGYKKITDPAALLEGLNAGESRLFVADTKNKNNGYPVLYWQNRLTPEEEAAEQKKKEDAERVKKACAALALDTDPIKEACVLALPTALLDCAIQWESSSPDIISKTGTVTLPEANMVSVTLTATVTCGQSSERRAFCIPVWSKTIDAKVYLQAALDAMQWNFGELQPVYAQDGNILVKFQTVLESKGFDGITVTIQSTADQRLVSETGKIFYPKLDPNSYADGRQGKVFFTLGFDGETAAYPTGDGYSLLIPWDTSGVRETLENASETALSEGVLAANNPSLGAVSGDLELPSHINRGGGKYSYAEVTWESSDNAHISISDEKRQGSADNILYGAYVGKVHRDGGRHTVTVTATMKNPSTAVTVKKAFTVTVLPLSEQELTQTLDRMRAVLACYTADKLTDSATGNPIDVGAVDHDIQLVIPAKVVTEQELERLGYGRYWDYWNYKFSAESSDPECIEINSFRAVVYRPLGEDGSADRQVTLTVKMESRKNPNLFVTKDMTVTVRHLSREDIQARLALMDRAKEHYTGGLLGGNADAYSVIDDLAPFWEIVWNSDRSGVDFVRARSDMRGDGIIADTLPDWEEQEDWRLFRTSDRELLANETLILNKTPRENTFVKISSVLTDETLGKYYHKFKDAEGFDAEALAKFRQLYKQPVSAYVMVVGEERYTQAFASMKPIFKAQAFAQQMTAFKRQLDKPISVTFTLLGLDGAPMIAKTAETSFTKGATVFDVFKKLIADNHMSYTAKGSYLSSVNGLAERAHGGGSGWMYAVDGVFVNSYMNAQELSGGEDIIVLYVRNYKDANRRLDHTLPEEDGSSGGGTGTDGDAAKTKSDRPDGDSEYGDKKHIAAEAKGQTEPISGTTAVDRNAAADSPAKDGGSGNSGAEKGAGTQSGEESTAKGTTLIPAGIGALLILLILAVPVMKKRKRR